MLTREQIEEIQGEAREKGIAIKALRQEKAYPEIKKFETWMEVNILKCPPNAKSLMEEATSYTYKILKKLALYVADGRYKIDDNMVENSIRPLAVGHLCCTAHKRPYVGNTIMLASQNILCIFMTIAATMPTYLVAV